MKILKPLLCLGFVVGIGAARAGLQIPYTPDGNTLHLWHFDDSTANQGTTNFVTVTDAVTNGGITLTNFGLGIGGQPPFTNIFLVTNDITAPLEDSLGILPGDGGSAAAASHAMCAGPADLAPTNFANGSSGAFTFEALVNPRGNIFSSAAGNQEWEIFCGDNSAGTRGWQFRLQNGATPSVDFNFITASGGSPINTAVPLPTSGIDALATNQWYHVAVTFTGNTPTNSDLPGVLTFYWTLLDKSRTNADFLAAVTNSALGTIGGTPSPAVGGSQRTTHGVGNGGSFQGFIDEVRVSAIARQPNDMVFTTNAVINPPIIGSQPPAATFLGYGQPLTLNASVLGTLPISYQWQLSNSISGNWSNVAGQTNNTYSVSGVTFADGGFYRLIATNAALSANSVTSAVAQVQIGAVPDELFSTGYDTNGVIDPALTGFPDPHYSIVQSADINNLGPNAIVWNMGAYPLAAFSGAFANADGVSQWIGTEGNSYSSPVGQYTYRTSFLLDSVDLSQPVTISGTWWEYISGVGILLNGQPTGNTGVHNNAQAANAFIITNGFQPGLNTLDFVINEDGTGNYQESAVRVEIRGLGQALPAGLPVIANQPVSQTVEDANVAPGSVAIFSVVALGRPPLTYQWWADGNAISGATNRTLVFNSPSSTAPPGTNFSVVVNNASGSVTSSVAALTLLSTDQPPVLASYSLVIYSNTTASFNLDTAFAAATDANHSPLSLGSPPFDTVSTNGASITQNGVVLTYTPVTDYLGQDEFNYYLADSQGINTAGAVNITIVPLLVPATFTANVSGGKVVLQGAGASAGGSFQILATTNLLTPPTNWVSILATNFDRRGNFNVPLPANPGEPQSFYLISVP